MTAPRSSAGTRTGLGLLLIGTVAIGVAYAATAVLGAPPAWAPWFLVIGAASTPVGLFVVGAVTRGIWSRRMAALLASLFVLLFASFGIALSLAPDEGAMGPLLLGLPVRLAVVFYGVGFAPLVILPLAFASTFHDGDAPASLPDGDGGRSDAT